MDFIKGADRHQKLLFPEAIEDFITDENPVRFIEAFVHSLNLKKLGFKPLPETGRPPYNPEDLLKLYLYGYLNSVRSSRKLERETHRNLEVLWLLNKLQPDFKTIADFRKDNIESLRRVSKQFILVCKHQDLFGSELLAIDGSKFRAVNNNEKNITERRLKRDLAEADEKISTYLKDLDFYDKQEESTHKKLTVKELKKKIDDLNKRKEKLDEKQEDLDYSPDGQISETDPDSRSMLSEGVTKVCYNVQTVVDEKHHMIIEADVTNHPTDQNELYTMARQAKDTLGCEKVNVVADRGYYNGHEIKQCEDDSITVFTEKPETSANKKLGLFHKGMFVYDAQKDSYQCPAGETLKFRSMLNEKGRLTRYYVTPACRTCPLKKKCTRGDQRRISRWEHENVLDRMKKRVQEHPEMMKKRRCLVEHPFGTMKRWMDQGFFLMKGLPNVRAEFSLTVFSYNLKRAINILGVKKLIQAVS